jgi:thiol-disulfide isomerase/thioredoxin
MRRRFYFIITLLALFAFTSCNRENTKQQGDTVIIFKNPVDQNKLTDNNGKTITEIKKKEYISYTDSSNINIDYFPVKDTDTLIIGRDSRKYIEIKHNYRCIDHIYYLIKRGDTVVVSYDTLSYPTLTSKTSNKLTYLYNINKTFPDRTSCFNTDALNYISSVYYMMLSWRNEKYGNLTDEEESHYVSFTDAIDSYRKYINSFTTAIISLKNTEQMDSEYYNYLKKQLRYKELKLNYKVFAETDRKNSTKRDSFLTAYRKELNDNQLSFISYKDFVNSYSVIESGRDNVKIVKAGCGICRDFRTIFDNISSEESIPPKTKQFLLARYLKDIYDCFSDVDANDYTGKYLSVTNDTTYIAKLQSKDTPLSDTDYSGLHLESLNGEKLTLKDILNNNRGKVVYIDFWASWCKPCRNAMPFAKKLRETYKNRDIAFIYLALGDKDKPWRDAINKEDLNDGCQNYIVTNSKNSKLLKKLNVKTIPRYLIFDKTGKLYNKKAPGPEGDLIKTELDKILS